MDPTRPDAGRSAALADPPRGRHGAPLAPAPSSEPEPKPRKKELRRLLGEARRLDPWERYRALNDAVDEAYEVIDHCNREARFALLVMGILNAFVVISASRAEVVGSLDTAQRTVAAGLLGIYAVTAIFFVHHAIAALHPGKFRPRLGEWKSQDTVPAGLRYYEDVIARDVFGHWKAWHDVTIGQLNAEIAVQFHSLCVKTEVKRVALTRLFGGLRVMTMLVAALMVLFVYAAWL
jgi:hypothetical protein